MLLTEGLQFCWGGAWVLWPLCPIGAGGRAVECQEGERSNIVFLNGRERFVIIA